MISSMKGVKLAGLTEKLADIIQQLRITEVNSALKFRMLQAGNAIFCRFSLPFNIFTEQLAFIPMLISPVITFAVFVALSSKSGGTLDTAKMFTSLSLVSLLTAPLSVVFQSIPAFMAAVGCFQRIQKYLLTDTKSDHRLRNHHSNSLELKRRVSNFKT
jgi:ATP-binding cassette subfamily C (CFTR/MRP) protein 1